MHTALFKKLRSDPAVHRLFEFKTKTHVLSCCWDYHPSNCGCLVDLSHTPRLSAEIRRPTDTLAGRIFQTPSLLSLRLNIEIERLHLESVSDFSSSLVCSGGISHDSPPKPC